MDPDWPLLRKSRNSLKAFLMALPRVLPASILLRVRRNIPSVGTKLVLAVSTVGRSLRIHMRMAVRTPFDSYPSDFQTAGNCFALNARAPVSQTLCALFKYFASNCIIGYGPQGAPQPTASPGPGKPRPARGPPGPPTPQQNSAAPYPGSPQVPRPTPPPGQLHEPPNALAATTPNVGNTLAELDPEHVDERFKREGQDWFAIFNPRVRRVLDVNLVHTLPHQSVVCCVRFSADGRYVATGCNRSAQIFDVQTGQLRAHLQDSSLGEDGDLYIRSVCFSPDGKYLATGAEDKIIRVRGEFDYFWNLKTNRP